jgi:pilus assembly protein CpaC
MINRIAPLAPRPTSRLCGSRRCCGADATSAADPLVGLPGEQKKPDEGVRRGPGVRPTFLWPVRFLVSTLLLLPLAVAQETVPATGTGSAPNQSPQSFKTLALVTGRGELLQFPNDIKQVAASEPKIADVVVISPREVMVNAKEAGKTTVVIWDSLNGPMRYNVDVSADSSELDAFRQEFARDLPGSNIQLTGKGETIVLTGTVTNEEQSKKAAALAQTRAKTVVNMLKPPQKDPKQVVLKVVFASIDRTVLNQWGFNLFSKNGVLVGESSTEQFSSPRFSQLQYTNGSFTNSSSVNFADLLNLFVYRPDLNIGATIKALQENDLLQVLAEPNLVALDGKEASFLAGGSFPFPVLTTTSTGGSTSPVVTVQFKPFGVRLTFTPTITASGSIDLKVAPEVSDLDFSNAVTLQGFLIPALSQRNTDTEVILKDGESLVIAGLLDNRVTENLVKIPWLGDVPILGQLFKSRQTKKSSSELLVVITPRVAQPIPPGDQAQLPAFVEPFLKSSAEVKAMKDKALAEKTAKKKKDTKDPEFVGPRGHQEPQQ